MITFLAGVVVGATSWALVAKIVDAVEYARARRMLRRFYVLAALERGPCLGIELIRDSGGLLRRSTAYVHLAALEEEGVIEGFPEPDPPSGAPARRMYRLPRSAP